VASHLGLGAGGGDPWRSRACEASRPTDGVVSSRLSTRVVRCIENRVTDVRVCTDRSALETVDLHSKGSRQLNRGHVTGRIGYNAKADGT
jgi:hypothetical protein